MEDGKPLSREESVIVLNMRLESYEDTLINLQITRSNTQELALNSNPQFKEGYMLHYMLDVETQGSLLNLDWFINPFDCYLQVTKIMNWSLPK
ncbi:MAG: hypothetical protein IPG79_17825 [Saprospiraceae bacterium]|nr:hypothetical protein [Saprospiraceae bacterium]